MRLPDGTWLMVFSARAPGKGFTSTPFLDLAETPSFIPGDPTLADVGGSWQLFYGIGPGQGSAEGIYPATAAAPTAAPKTKTGAKAAKATTKGKKTLPLCKPGVRSTKRHPCRHR